MSSRWRAIAKVASGEPGTEHDLSHTEAVEIGIPSWWRCVAGPVRIDPDGTERCEVVFTFAADRWTAEHVQPANEPLREPTYVQVPASEHGPLITIVVGVLAGDDGGGRARVAA
jgi:hypothetical protein